MQYDSLKQMPAGGLASFLTSNMDEIEDNVLAFGAPRGINSMMEIGNRMAMMGRNGDDQLVHMRTGEIAVSPQLLEENPRLASELADAFDRSNVDMARYQVGNPANSVNPMTGQREFFLKKLIGGIKDIFKKIAPVIVPIGLNLLFPGLGTVASGALGAGIGTLAQGGSFQDALKSAAVGGLVGGVTSAFRAGSLTSPEFTQSAFGTPGQRFTINPEIKSFFTGADNFRASPSGTTGETSNILKDSIRPRARPEGLSPPPSQDIAGNVDVSKQKGFFDYLDPNRGMPTQEKILARATEIRNSPAGQKLGLTSEKALEMATEELTPGLISRYTPLAVTGAAALAAAGGFETPKQNLDDSPFGMTSQEMYNRNPMAYDVFAASNMPTPMSRIRPLDKDEDREYLFRSYLNKGGEMSSDKFPRRQGAISGPGTETSDDIPAMLSDGEFVMTARAVRGAGNGSRKQGVKKMYDMMRAFEGGVVA